MTPGFAAFGWLLVAAGWMVGHYLSVVRDRQKEVKDHKDALIKRIWELEKNIVEFHCGNAFNAALASQIMAEISRIGIAIGRKPVNRFLSPTKVVKSLRQASTLRNFDQSTFKPISHNDDLINNVRYWAEALANELEDAYQLRYFGSWKSLFTW